jgi:large repetitive protein
LKIVLLCQKRRLVFEVIDEGGMVGAKWVGLLSGSVLALSATSSGCGRASGVGTPDEGAPIVMNPDPSASLPNATVGHPYTQTFQVTGGGLPPYVIAATSLPPGLTYVPDSGVVSGTPTQPGSYSIEIDITDQDQTLTTFDYALTVLSALTITPGSLPGGHVGQSYSQPITASAGTAPYTFGTEGNLPPGLSLGVSGQPSLSGTPTATGTFTFTVTAIDSSSPNESGSQIYTVTIQ